MGKELSLARIKEAGRSVLLAIPSSGELITTSSSRNQRTQESSSSKVSKGGTTEDIETESQSSSEVERANASSSKQARRRRSNKDRKQGRGDERAHRRVRRSAQELGIVHPGHFCNEAETIGHYWTEVDRISGGSLFQCKLCLDYIWLPLFYNDTIYLGKMMEHFGRTEGYCRYLNRHRPAKLLIAKLQDLRRLEAEITDKREFAKLVDKILSDMEYDRKEG